MKEDFTYCDWPGNNCDWPHCNHDGCHAKNQTKKIDNIKKAIQKYMCPISKGHEFRFHNAMKKNGTQL